MSDHDDKDLPLRDDIRLLGRLLGDTVREQEGDGGLRPRSSASAAVRIAFHRDNDAEARAELEAILDGSAPTRP